MSNYTIAPPDLVPGLLPNTLPDIPPDHFALHWQEGSHPEGIPIKSDHYAIVLCLRGKATKIIGPFTMEVKPHTLYLVAPHYTHYFENSSADLQLFSILFKKEFLADSFFKDYALEALLYANSECPPLHALPEPHYERILQLFRKMYREQQQADRFHLQMSRLLLMELLYEMNRAIVKCSSDQAHPLTRQHQLYTDFLQLVDAHYLQKRTVQEYADMLFVSAKHLSEVVKHETGKNALYFIHRRLHLDARHLLTTSALSVKEISERLNFDTSSHFSRFFKNITGANPSEYKRGL
ncbi:AraC family transcriptional regulator [Chitinophaga costaii]|nr:helix-turn-helix domain-containing protein [Chitinophaga costaii]PUZ24631.1 AraC family transcriptional regulator [Chitinophaga costaii]